MSRPADNMRINELETLLKETNISRETLCEKWGQACLALEQAKAEIVFWESCYHSTEKELCSLRYSLKNGQ